MLPFSRRARGSLVVRNVHLAAEDDQDDSGVLFDVHCESGRVVSIAPAHGTSWRIGNSVKRALGFKDIGGETGVLLPSLCHSHIHLDKCFLLEQCRPLQSGSFQEALSITAEAKANFPYDLNDVYERGRRLVSESIECGVTAMRAHVEVDKTVGLHCLDVALRLKAEFAESCEIQIAAFAQDPIFDDPEDRVPGVNFDLLSEAASHPDVSAVGSAPYVERSDDHARRNIALVLATAEFRHRLVDFHLDYNVSPNAQPLINTVLNEMRGMEWISKGLGRVAIGHCTRYALFDEAEWTRLRADVGDLPVAFVALPQSDLYMMGRTAHPSQLAARGTLPVPYMASRGFDVAMAVNNVGNAFTPQGSVDPLSLCPLGVVVYQNATDDVCGTLLKCVSTASKSAIGLGPSDAGLRIRLGDPADFVLLHDNDSVRSAALCPCYERTTIRSGTVTATRRAERWSMAQRVSAPACVFGIPVRWEVWVGTCMAAGLWGGWKLCKAVAD